MDLTYYFQNKSSIIDIEKIKKNNKLRETREEFINILKDLLKNGAIDMLIFNNIIDFYKTRGKLTNLLSYTKLINSIVNNQIIDQKVRDNFSTINREVFKHIYDLFKNSDFNEKSLDIEQIQRMIIETNKESINFTDDQINAIRNIMWFLCDDEATSFRLNGYAGTGKTTTVSKLTVFLLAKKYIKSVAFVAPTNKAVNVIKSKFRTDVCTLVKDNNLSLMQQLDVLESKGLSIHFLTIHKLLNYKNDFDIDGERIFVKGNKSNILTYDLIVVDECSMVMFQIIVNIFASIDNIIRSAGKDKTGIKIPKILYVGDPAQLPPVNENVSIIFSDNKKDFNFELYKKVLTDDNNIYKEFNKDVNIIFENHFNIFVNKVISQKTSNLEQVVRSNDNKVVGICNEIRSWVLGRIKQPKIGQYVGDKVKIYKYNKGDKTKTNWFLTCLNYFKKNNDMSNIILTWTNRQCDEYNTKLRQMMFSKDNLNKFERGDILILNDFYNIKESEIEDKGKVKRFYTSEQIKVTDIEEVMKAVPEFTENIPIRIKKMENNVFIEDKFIKTIKIINKGITRKYNSWKLHVQKLTEIIVKDTIPEVYFLYSVKDEHKELLEKDKQFVAEKIKDLRKIYITFLKDKVDILDKEIIRPLWRELNNRLVEPFAECNYGAVLTAHKCQSSTYFNVFVDAHDIINNPNENEAKRCLYTALTRTSNELHILL